MRSRLLADMKEDYRLLHSIVSSYPSDIVIEAFGPFSRRFGSDGFGSDGYRVSEWANLWADFFFAAEEVFDEQT